MNGIVSYLDNGDGTHTFGVDGGNAVTLPKDGRAVYAKVTADPNSEGGWKLTISRTPKRGFRPVS